MSKYYGYACVTSTKYDRDNKEERKNSKQYHSLVSKCETLGITLEDVYIDLLSDFYKEREELDKLCDLIDVEDVMVMDSIFALGTCLHDIKDNIMLVNGSCLFRILTPYKELDFSTAHRPDEGLDALEKRIEQFVDLLDVKDGTTLIPFSGYQGRPAIPITDEFIEIYWLYENFFIDEKTALKNKLFKMAKASFHSKCRLYELSRNYKEDLLIQQELHHISLKPKRSGKVPEWFTEEFMCEVDSDPDAVSTICIERNILPISRIEYERWKTKYLIGRKGLFETSKKYTNNSLMYSLAIEQLPE